MSKNPINPTEIGERLRSWGLAKYGTVNDFAIALDIPQPQLSNYMAGRRKPGNKMQTKLRALGCDIEWLMTGRKAYSEGGSQARIVAEAKLAFHAPDGMSIEKREQIQKMIKDLSELEPGDIERAREVVRAAFKKKK